MAIQTHASAGPPATDPYRHAAAEMIARLASGNATIPPYPAVVARLQKLISEERTGTHQLSSAIATDPVLSATVLARASSPAFGAAPTASLEVAVSRLGGIELMQMALACTLGKLAASHGPLASLRRQRWRDSLIAAGVCEALAPRRSLRGDLAYTAGLLHDFGAIVAVGCLEEQLGPRPAAMPEEFWQDLVARIHVEVGVHVARAWKLPPELTEVMAHHHDADLSSRAPIVRLVALADRVTAALHDASEERPVQLHGIAGLDPDDVQQVVGMLPRLVMRLGELEGAMPPVKATVAAPSVVFRAKPGPSWWPVEMAIRTRRVQYTSVKISLDAFSFRGAEPLRPDWIAVMTLDDGADTLEIFANVRACEVATGGVYDMIAAPFGLAGADLGTWQRIVDRVRNAARARQGAQGA